MSLLPPWSIETQDHELASAAARGDVVRLRALLPSLQWSLTDEGPPIDRAIALDGLMKYTPLTHAAIGGHLAAITVLLEFGAQVNQAGSIEMTPLHAAVLHRQQAVIEPLIKAGASLQQHDGMGHTPLMLAVLGGDATLVQRLLDLGADPAQPGGQGNTPLHIAVEQDHDLGAIVTLLLNRGADPEVKNANGCTPQEWGRSSFGAGETSAAYRALVEHRVQQERQALKQALHENGKTPNTGPGVRDKRPRL